MSKIGEWQKAIHIIENPTRAEILRYFSEHPGIEITTLELSKILKKPESTLSINLTELREIGILVNKKTGKRVWYWVVSDDVNKALKEAFDKIQFAYNKTISGKGGEGKK